MKRANARLRLCFLLALFLQVAVFRQLASAQTAEKIPLPEYFGLYGLDKENLFALHDGKSSNQPATRTIASKHGQFSAPELTASVRFIVFDPTPSGVLKDLTLYRLPYVRNVITVPDLNQKLIGNVTRDPLLTTPSTSPLMDWTVIRVPSLQVNLLTKPIAGQAQMVLVVPERELDPGMYGLGYTPSPLSEDRRWELIFVVNFSAANQTSTCIDLVLLGGFSGPLVNPKGTFPLLDSGQ